MLGNINNPDIRWAVNARTYLCIILIILLGLIGALFVQVRVENLQKQNALQNERIATIEKELTELRAEISKTPAAQKQQEGTKEDFGVALSETTQWQGLVNDVNLLKGKTENLQGSINNVNQTLETRVLNGWLPDSGIENVPMAIEFAEQRALLNAIRTAVQIAERKDRGVALAVTSDTKLVSFGQALEKAPNGEGELVPVRDGKVTVFVKGKSFVVDANAGDIISVFSFGNYICISVLDAATSTQSEDYFVNLETLVLQNDMPTE
jgi:hypothetical protein